MLEVVESLTLNKSFSTSWLSINNYKDDHQYIFHMEGDMVDPGFPVSHTTTTGTTTTTMRVTSNIRFDPSYVNIRNIPGILKCAQLVSDLVTALLPVPLFALPSYHPFV
nr:uncharacterized protein LOC128691824 [Cherax quadricarinatus]